MKLLKKDRIVLYFLFVEGDITTVELARLFNMHSQTVGDYLSGYFKNRSYYDKLLKEYKHVKLKTLIG